MSAEVGIPEKMCKGGGVRNKQGCITMVFMVANLAHPALKVYIFHPKYSLLHRDRDVVASRLSMSYGT
jgi:hypothetical protein